MRRLAPLLVLATSACGQSNAEIGAPLDGGPTAMTDATTSPLASDGAPDSTSTEDATNAPDGGAPAPSNDGGGFRCAGRVGAVGDSTVNLTSGTTARASQLHVPKSYDASAGAMLILNFHGNGSTGAQEATWSNMNASSDALGYVVAYPEGVSDSFNAGTCCGAAATSGVDDVKFVRDLVTKISADYCIDPKRIFATGISNGGLLSYRLACEMSDVIAAIAPVAGTLAIDPSACNPSRPVPVLDFQGTSDLVLPYDGGPSPSDPLYVFRGVPETIAIWRQKSGCGDTVTPAFTHGDTSCVTYGPCPGNDTIELCTITGGGHTWPSGAVPVLFGKTSTDSDATAMMAAFFAAHPLP